MSRIVIDARLESGRAGGIEQAIRGLVSGLAADGDAHDEVVVVGWAGLEGWLPQPPPGSNMRIESVAPPSTGRAARLLRRNLFGRTLLPRLATMRARVDHVKDGSPLDAFDPDVIHFAHQRGELTRTESIYEPWDLQHLHHPQLFTKAEHERRERWYRALCHDATVIVVHCEAVRRDLHSFYAIADDRIVTVPMASVLSLDAVPAADEMAARRHALAVPPRYALFPAQGWPHKNHRRLIEALALLRGRGVEVRVVCPGTTNAYAATVRAAAIDAGVGDLLCLPGYVSSIDLRSLYDGATMLVFPSLHEGFGLPIIEALDAGVPVVCSRIESLAELAGEAAVYFDPIDRESIAEQISLLWRDRDACARYQVLARERARDFSWSQTASAYRSVYRRVVPASVTS